MKRLAPGGAALALLLALSAAGGHARTAAAASASPASPAAPSAAAVSAASAAAPAPAASSASPAAPALGRYAALLGTRGFSTPLLLDMGDAWLRAGHAGWAILDYERASWLAPRNAAVSASLSAAQERAGVSVPDPGAWAAGIRRLRFDTYCWIAVAGLVLLCAGVVLLRLGDGRRDWARPLILVGVLLACVAVDAGVFYWPDLSRAVVVQGPAAVRIAPAAAAAESFDVREGEVVYLQDRFDAFERIRTADGRSGWVSAVQLAPVLVSAAQAREELPRAAASVAVAAAAAGSRS